VPNSSVLAVGSFSEGSSPEDITVPDGTQMLIFFGRDNDGNSGDPGYVRVEGVDAEILDTAEEDNGSYGACACFTAYFVDPPKGSGITITWGDAAFDIVWFAVRGIFPTDPFADHEDNAMATTERYQSNEVTMNGVPGSLVLFRNVFNAANDTVDFTHTDATNGSGYGYLPADGTADVGCYKDASGSSTLATVSAVLLNFPPAVRRAGIILD
jgi:hypothetical protein